MYLKKRLFNVSRGRGVDKRKSPLKKSGEQIASPKKLFGDTNAYVRVEINICSWK